LTGRIWRNIIYVGWVKPGEIYQYYMASDVAVYPGGQSVLWQQAIACGLPLICKYWYGCEYLDLGAMFYL
jgi:glycosyltransferase involved in cell wall biosynthesis